MEKIKKYNKIKNDVQEFIDKFNSVTKDDVIVEEFLQGWRILYSNIIEDCKVLLVGINPGSGEDIGTRNYELDPLESLEYLDNRRNNYSLANLVKTIFLKAELFDVLENSAMKINTKFYATYGVNEIKGFEKHLAEHFKEIYSELMEKNEKWITKLVNIVNPKIVIAEGWEAFHFLDDKIFTNENKEWICIKPWNNVVGVWKRNDGLIFFGFTRRRGNFENEIAENLKLLIFQ